MKHLIQVIILIVALYISAYAQSDRHAYPIRSIAEIVQAHSGEVSKKSDLIVSAIARLSSAWLEGLFRCVPPH